MNNNLVVFDLLSVDLIDPNPDQPRKEFSEEDMESLADSIGTYGVMNPIAVKGPTEAGRYILIDGERRLRASKMAEKKTVPAAIHASIDPDVDSLMLAVITNLQRVDLNPIEEGAAYKRLLDMGYTVAAICRMVGKSYPTVDMRLKLLQFEPAIQDQYSAGRLPLDNKAISALQILPDNIRIKAAMKFAASGATARQIESTCSRLINTKNLFRYTPNKKFDRKAIPSIELSGARPIPAFTVLSERGKMPAWNLIEEAARGTCDDCLIRDSASLENCKDCGAVDLLSRLIKLAERA